MRCVGQVILSYIRPGGGTVSAAEVPILQQMVEIILQRLSYSRRAGLCWLAKGVQSCIFCYKSFSGRQ